MNITITLENNLPCVGIQGFVHLETLKYQGLKSQAYFFGNSMYFKCTRSGQIHKLMHAVVEKGQLVSARYLRKIARMQETLRRRKEAKELKQKQKFQEMREFNQKVVDAITKNTEKLEHQMEEQLKTMPKQEVEAYRERQKSFKEKHEEAMARFEAEQKKNREKTAKEMEILTKAIMNTTFTEEDIIKTVNFDKWKLWIHDQKKLDELSAKMGEKWVQRRIRWTNEWLQGMHRY